MVSEKRLRIEMTVVNKMIKEKDVSTKWIETSKQLADFFPKREVSTHTLNTVLSTGEIQD